MDIVRAKEIIHTLADGVDPTTGEVFPADHVCNRADIICALCIAEQALQMDINRPEDGPWHKKYGKVWSLQETDTLIILFDKHYTVAQIAKQISRSEAAVRAKLVRLGKIKNRKDAK